MNVLVTGGAGFIGTNLCEHLVSLGLKVVALDNLSVSDTNVSFLEDLGVDVVVKDIVDFESIEKLFIGIDVVVHLAAMNRAQRSIENPLESNRINVEGTINCLEASKRACVKRFINISSSSVYAQKRDILLEETMSVSPPHPYGVGKLAGEFYSKIYHDLYNLETVTLRFFSVYGPKQLGSIDKAGVVAKFIHHAMQGIPLEIYGSGVQKRNFSYVGDVVEYVMRAIEVDGAVGEVINIANPTEVSVNELVEVVAEVTGKPLTTVNVDSLKGDPERNPANTEKCISLLGYESQYSFKQGVQKTFSWYKSVN